MSHTGAMASEEPLTRVCAGQGLEAEGKGFEPLSAGSPH